MSFCDEIIVVDSHSTDATRELAASRGVMNTATSEKTRVDVVDCAKTYDGGVRALRATSLRVDRSALRKLDTDS